jgi:hypothetical protein
VDVLALILACSLHPDDVLVRTLVDVQSQGNVYFVGDLATLKTHDNLTSAADALRAAEDIASHGGRPAVGLLGIPVDWAARFGRSPRDLFDACTNIAIGTAMFSEFDAACSPRPPAPRRASASVRSARAPRRLQSMGAKRTCVLARLATELGLHGTPAEILKRIDLHTTDVGGPAHESAIFGDGVADAQELPAAWSDRRIYLEAGDHVTKSGANAPATAAKAAKRPGTTSAR